MIHAKGIRYHVGDFQFGELSLRVDRGEYFVLLGPPGSGKTVFLECLCGLRPIQAGRIFLGGRDATHLEPRSRGVGYVPQDYALFPHLRVEQNIAFALRTRRSGRRSIRQRVGEVAEMLGIGCLLGRSVEGLSGGEKQRVSLARALAMQPNVLLLDEPVCALDEAIRQEVCGQLRRLQRELRLTVIHVSHNLEEAFVVADRAGLLRDGRLLQTGTMPELLRRPHTEFVARFMRCTNIFSGQAVGPGPAKDTTRIRVGQTDLVVPGRHEGTVRFVIRPECVQVHQGSDPAPWDDSDPNRAMRTSRLPVLLASHADCGSYVRLDLDSAIRLVAHVSHPAWTRPRLGTGAPLVALLPWDDIHVLDEAAG